MNLFTYLHCTKAMYKLCTTLSDIRKFIGKVQEIDFIANARRCERARIGHTSENIDSVTESVHEN